MICRMSYTDFKLHSHPGMLLKDHLEQVTDKGLRRFRENSVFPESELLLKVILSFHDLGKGSAYFQNYLMNGAPRSNLTRHSEFSAIWAFHYCSSVLKLPPLDRFFAYICVNAHHGNLGDMDELLAPGLDQSELAEINQQIDYIELNAILERLDIGNCLSSNGFEEALGDLDKKSLASQFRRQRSSISDEQWLRLEYLFSILIWADKHSAIFNSDCLDANTRKWNTRIIDNYKKNLPPARGVIGSIRNEAYDTLSNNLRPEINTYSVNMPTGSGKTISTLKVALELRKSHPGLQRIIYSLPFTSIIDQNYSVFSKILRHSLSSFGSETLLAHHHLADFGYHGANEYADNEAEYLVETWDSELVVTTFAQLLASCLSIRNTNLKRLHRFAHAVVILDEVQNIPHHYWELLRHVLKQLSKHLNSVVMLVTATLPMIFDPNDPDLVELATSKDLWFSKLDRVEIHRSYLSEKMELSGLAKLVANDDKEDSSLNRLIIVNTVQCSLDLYMMLKEACPCQRLIYLSSNVIPKQRLERINEIRENSGRGLIIVSTQVVEAGVDIDVDIVYRDLAPLDSIIQAAGRCNRNESKNRSRVVVFQLFADSTPYWRYIYDETLIHATKKTLGTDASPLQEADLHKISNQYYEYLAQASARDISKSIIRSLARLDLGSALNYDSRENPNAFHLIESHPAQTVFVELDGTSSALLESYRSVISTYHTGDFEARSELRKLQRQMGPYMINVDKRYLESESRIHIIGKDVLSQYYDLETGFIRKARQADYIF